MKAHLITATTAMALGIGGTLATNGITASAAVPLTHHVSVSKTVSNDNAVVSAIWTRVATAMCPEAENESGFDSGSCSVEPGTVVSLTRGEADTHVSVTFAFASTLVKGAPQ